MTKLTFYRFIPTLEVLTEKNTCENYNIFKIKLDHVEFVEEYEKKAKDWLEDHYGKIIIDNSVKKIIKSNEVKFKDDMNKCGVKVLIKI